MKKLLGSWIALLGLLAPLICPAQAQESLKERLQACRAAKKPVAVRILGADPGEGNLLAFGQKFVTEIAGIDPQSSAVLSVWVADKMQVRLESGELKSFVGDAFPTQIPFATAVMSSDERPKLSESGNYQLALNQGERTAATFMVTATIGGELACGSAVHQFAMGAIDTYAIVVGFNYPESGHELKYARTDAQDVAMHLVQALGVKESNIWLITDESDGQVRVPRGANFVVPENPYAIRRAFSSILAKADQQSRLYIYFSGHMLLPEAITDSKGSLSGPSFVLPNSKIENQDTFLNRERFMKEIMKANLASVAIILDACFSGSATTAYPTTHEPIPGSKSWQPLRSGTAQPLAGEPLPSAASIASSDGSSPSWELDELKHGVFTFFLLKAAQSRQELTLHAAFVEAKKEMGKLRPQGWTKPFRQAPTDSWGNGSTEIPWRSAP